MVAPYTAIDPAQFGLVGDGSPNTLANFQAALNAAGAAGGDLLFGPGDWNIVIPSANASPQAAWLPQSQISILGQGSRRTRLRLEVHDDGSPPAAGTFSSLFHIDPLGGQVYFADLELSGPLQWDDSVNPHVGKNGDWCQATTNLIELRGSTGKVETTFEGCRFTNNFIGGVVFDDTPAPDVTLRMINCDLDVLGCPVGVGSAAGDIRQATLRDCRFLRAGIPAARAGGKAWNHLGYFTGAAVLLDGCSFAGCELNLQFYSGAGIGAESAYVILQNCRADNTMLGYFLLPDGAQVLGGEFHNGAGFILGRGAHIVGARVSGPVNNGFQSGPPVVVRSSTLLNLFSANQAAGVAGQPGGYTVLQGCTAQRGVKVGATDPITTTVAPHGGTTLVSDCAFFGGDIRLGGTDRMPATAAIEPVGGLVLVRGGLSAGDYGYYSGGTGPISLRGGSTAVVDVEGHTFDIGPIPGHDPNDPQPALYCDGSIPANAMRARECTFLSGCMPFSVASPQSVEPRAGICPTPVLAAPVLNLLEGYNYTKFQVSGTADVGQLTISNFADLGSRIYNQRCYAFGSRLTLEAIHGFRLVPGPASAVGAILIDLPIEVPAGSAVILEHNNTGWCTWGVVS